MRAIAAISMVLFSAAPLHPGEVRFAAPLVLPDVPGPVSIASGDLDGDGRPDLVSADGSGRIEILFQAPANRTAWGRRLSAGAGFGAYMVRAVDLEGDGRDEVLVADPGTTAYLLRGVGEPEPLRQARSPRWITAGDWNGDGHLDVASASTDRGAVSILTGDGSGALSLRRDVVVGDPHAVESLDHDGDGDLDLVVGHGDQGFRHLDGSGDGTFLVQGLATGLPPCARFVHTGDFDGDGKGDIVLSCLRNTPQGPIANVVAGTSNGDGSYSGTLDLVTDGIAAAAVADLTGDGVQDLALVAAGSRVLSIHPGKGDGSFRPEMPFGATGEAPLSVIARDVDRDGFPDIVTGNRGSSTLTVFWGQGGARFLAGASLIQGATGSSSAVADLDGDGAPDFFFARSSPPGVDVFLRPGLEPSSSPSLAIPTAGAWSHLTVADLSGDGTPDLAGVTLADATLHVALLDVRGGVSREGSIPVGGFPAGLEAGRLDGGDTVDLAILRIASSDIAIFLSRDGGTLSAAPAVPTLDVARTLALGDADSDGHADIAVAADGVLAIHHGSGDGTFSVERVLHQDQPRRAYTGLAFGDVTGDSLQDIVLAAGTAEVIVLRGNGRREPVEPIPIRVSSAPRSLHLADIDRDGLIDITTSNAGRTISIIINKGVDGLQPPIDWRGSLPPALDHVVTDLDGDGLPDLVLFAAGSTYIFAGIPSDPPPGSFRRGDADENGKTELTDAVALLRHLFQGADAPCEDASDADDDGGLGLTDAVVILRWLFQGEPPPPAPGPLDCGEDPTADGLRGCSAECR
jgi:hypothetical protein